MSSRNYVWVEGAVVQLPDSAHEHHHHCTVDADGLWHCAPACRIQRDPSLEQGRVVEIERAAPRAP